MTIINLNNDYFLVKFDLQEDLNTVITEGPWTVQGHYLTVRRWSPNFWPNTVTIDFTLAWIRFPNLLVIYYDDDLLRVVAFVVGNLIKIDKHTSLAFRGRFARVYVELNLNKPLVAQF